MLSTLPHQEFGTPYRLILEKSSHFQYWDVWHCTILWHCKVVLQQEFDSATLIIFLPLVSRSVSRWVGWSVGQLVN